jgi:6-phosphogluconolactonase
MSGEVVVARDREELAALASELMARALREAVDRRGVARVALSGGTTPAETYQRLRGYELPFERVEWFWVDERAATKESPRSNFGAAVVDLGSSIAAAREPGPMGQFFPMEGEAEDLAAAAARYEALLRDRFGVAAAVAFDAMTLGIGDDGHTASLFPGMGTVRIDGRLVVAVPAQPEKKLEARLTMTAPVIREARLVLVLARGESKRAVVEAARSPGSVDEVPARVVQGAKGRVVWVVDQAAEPA